MASRSGGYNIPVIAVLVVLVAVLGIWVAVLNGDLTKAQEDVVNKDADVKRAQANAVELGAQNADLWKLLSGQDGTLDKSVLPEFEETLAMAGKKLAEADGSVAGQFGSYAELTVAQQTVVKALKERLESQTLDAAAYRKKERVAKSTQADAEATHKGSLKKLKGELEDRQTKLEQVTAQAAETNDGWRRRFEESSESSQTTIADLKAEILVLTNKVLRAQDRISVLEREKVAEKTYAQVDPDGKVLRVSEGEGLAWIDRGRDHKLRRGTVFEVFQYGKGGQKLRKGRIEVASVDENFSQVRVLETVDELNPISEGDQISSPFYDQSEVPSFVIAGDELQSSRYSIEEVTRRIDTFGGKVQGKVTIHTSFVVAIEGYEDSEAYNEARKLGITVIRERELYQFIGL